MTSAHAGSRGSQLPGSGSPRTSPCQEWGGVSGLCCGSDTVGLDIATAAHAARPAGLLLQSPVRVHRCPPGAPGKTPRAALLPAGFPGGWRGRARRSGWTVLGSRPAAELQRPAEPQPQGGLRQPQPTASAWGSPQRGHLQRGLAPFGAVPEGRHSRRPHGGLHQTGLPQTHSQGGGPARPAPRWSFGAASGSGSRVRFGSVSGSHWTQ